MDVIADIIATAGCGMGKQAFLEGMIIANH